jgi:hypothetical protein
METGVYYARVWHVDFPTPFYKIGASKWNAAQRLTSKRLIVVEIARWPKPTREAALAAEAALLLPLANERGLLPRALQPVEGSTEIFARDVLGLDPDPGEKPNPFVRPQNPRQRRLTPFAPDSPAPRPQLFRTYTPEVAAILEEIGATSIAEASQWLGLAISGRLRKGWTPRQAFGLEPRPPRQRPYYVAKRMEPQAKLNIVKGRRRLPERCLATAPTSALDVQRQ